VTLGKEVSEFIAERLDEFILQPAETESALASARGHLPEEVVGQLTRVLALKALGYRDGVIIQLSFGLLSSQPIDSTKRPEGGRGVAQRLGTLLAARHIAAVKDAYQNIAKNTKELCRGNDADFDSFLRWANSASRKERLSALEFVLASVALTARPVAPMPALDRTNLTFYKVAKFIYFLLRVPSGGAHEQFAVAAFLHALIDEFGMGGPGNLYVETKSINAADTSALTAGDVQVKRGNRVEEAFEVTAKDWQSKVEGAARAMRDHDLQRAHIIGAVARDFIVDAVELRQRDVDLSIIDVEALLLTLTAIMRKPSRELALRRLYELLDRHQPNIELVNGYVRLLNEHGLTE
jgi:hypothetical protein